MATDLEKRGVDVKYAIDPVAARMPGHMNVLLAEANVSYDQLLEMDQVNGESAQTDVVLVVGANDVGNPAARDDPSSPIDGMPILDVDKARNIIGAEAKHGARLRRHRERSLSSRADPDAFRRRTQCAPCRPRPIFAYNLPPDKFTARCYAGGSRQQ